MEARAPSLKERQRQEREQLILQAAEESLLERGFHDTSIDDIAARVGISKGTLYQHFSSKEELLLALFERAIPAFLANVDATLAAPGSPREKLRAILRHAYGMVSEKHVYLMGGKHISLLFGAITQAPEILKRLAEKRELIAATLDELERRLTSLLEEGKAAGEFDASMPTPVMLSMFTGVLAPRNYRRLVVREGMSVDEAITHVSSFFFKGIAAPPPRSGDHEACEGQAGRKGNRDTAHDNS